MSLGGGCRTAEDVAALAHSPALRGLRWLEFAYNALTPEAMAAWLASPYLRHLEALHLGSEYGEDGLKTQALHLLAGSSGLPRLRDLVVGLETDWDAVEALRRRFGARLRVWVDA